MKKSAHAQTNDSSYNKLQKLKPMIEPKTIDLPYIKWTWTICL